MITIIIIIIGIIIIIMKIRARSKIGYKTPLYTTIYNTYFYNYIKIILSPQTYWDLLAHFITQ